MRILVTGGTGMLGHALRKHLPDAVYVGSKDADLRDWVACQRLFLEDYDCVIHCAARVGGIKDNNDLPYEYFIDNAMINANVVSACVKHRVSKLIAISSTCVYPANPPSFPITEDMLHLGPPHETNFGYAYAKRMMQVQIDAARKQYGFKWSVVYPSNLYGPHDTFDLQRSHVVPALMMKMHAAKMAGAETVEVWGTSNARRQLTYVDDVAAFIASLVISEKCGDFNFAYPPELTIWEIATMIAAVIGFAGQFAFNSKLDGVAKKGVSMSQARELWGMDEMMKMHDLRTSLIKTYEWYLANGAPK